MKPLLLYSSCQEPFTKWLLQQGELIHALSLQQLLEEVEILDAIEDGIAKICWQLPSKEELTNSSNQLLINRIESLPKALFEEFDPQDQSYALCELRAYLQFALQSFPKVSSRPGMDSLMGNCYSLPQQWDIVCKAGMNLFVPEYFLGEMKHCLFNAEQESIVYSHPYQYYFWKASPIPLEHHFAFKRPQGEPWLVCSTSHQAKAVPRGKFSLSHPILEELAPKLCQVFEMPLAEMLFFVDDNKICFGMIHDIPYVSSKEPWFPKMAEAYMQELLSA